MSEYPEHDKLAEVQGETQVIGDFLDWAEGEGFQLMVVNDGTPYAAILEPCWRGGLESTCAP